MTFQIDDQLVINLIVLAWALNGAASIYMGATKAERKSYGNFEVFWGVMTLLFVVLVLAL